MIRPWTNVVLDTQDYVVYKDGFLLQKDIFLLFPKNKIGNIQVNAIKPHMHGGMIGLNPDIVMHTTLDRTVEVLQDKLWTIHVHPIPAPKEI